MKNVIDHAIQIPVSTTNIWNLIANPENNTKWQTDCKGVAFLNSVRRGVGMRWRSKDASGREYVSEIRAWYEGLGFEYVLVDGTNFSENQGRIRLQEVAEGTVVQWTFSYELSGLVGSIRNALGTKRRLDYTIVESLRNLYRVAKDEFKEIDIKEAKALMRDAPNVQERLSYKPRYPSVLEEGKQRAVQTPSTPQPPVLEPIAQLDSLYSRVPLTEPPLADDDTRPNPTIQQQVLPTSVEPVATSQSPVSTLLTLDESPSIVQHVENPSQAIKTITPPKEPELTTAGVSESVMSKFDLPKVDKRDTATISVFDLFGLPRPSDSQVLRPVSPTLESLQKDDEPLSKPTDIDSLDALRLRSTEILPALQPNLKNNSTKIGEEVSLSDIELFTAFPMAPDVTPPRMGLRKALRRKQSGTRSPQ